MLIVRRYTSKMAKRRPNINDFAGNVTTFQEWDKDGDDVGAGGGGWKKSDKKGIR